MQHWTSFPIILLSSVVLGRSSCADGFATHPFALPVRTRHRHIDHGQRASSAHVRRKAVLPAAFQPKASGTTPPVSLSKPDSPSPQEEGVDDFAKNGGPRELRVNPLYLTLATAETIYWYYLAPGIDPATPWFNPSDGELIASLLNPAFVTHPPPGSGLAFSSLLLNSFLILPAVWSLLLLQEDGPWCAGKRQFVPPWPFCLAGFGVGGGAIVPYMIFRRPVRERKCVDPARFPPLLRAFERDGPGPAILVALTAVILAAFVAEMSAPGVDWSVEWEAFACRARTSQFTSLALFDLAMISTAVLDPMADDARRRGLLGNGASGVEAVQRLWPYWLLPVIGPVTWIWDRPKFDVVE